jgi:hypothetical protein
MKTFSKAILAGSLLVVSSAAAGNEIAAPFRASVTAQSSAQILGGRWFGTMTRAKGIGQTKALQGIRTRLISEGIIGANGVERITGDGQIAESSGGEWRLHVLGTGEWIHFEHIAKTREFNARNGLPLSKAPSRSTLEPAARSAIAHLLPDVIQLRPSETLEVWGIAHERAGVINRALEKHEAIISSEITFTRAVDGIAVIGPGSKVHVRLNPNNEVVAFTVDWAPLDTTLENGVAAIETSASTAEIEARGNKIRNSRRLLEMSTASELECGYFDAGTFAPTLRDIRLACVSRSSGITRGGFKVNYSDVIPAGRVVIENADWPESVIIKK